MAVHTFRIKYNLPTEREDGTNFDLADFGSVKVFNGLAVLAEQTDGGAGYVDVQTSVAEGSSGTFAVKLFGINGKESAAAIANYTAPITAPPKPVVITEVTVS